MKRKMIRGLFVMAFLGTITGIVINTSETQAEDVETHVTKAEGEFLDYVSDADENIGKYYGADIDQIISDADSSELIEIGEDTVISRAEVEQYEKFYELNNTKDAEKKAVTYAEQRHALYIEAIRNGFDVTDQELAEYLSELKSNLSDVYSEEELHDMYAQYGLEEDYWQMEKDVYKIDLPIQKYAASLEEEFFKENEGKMDTEEINAAWSTEYESIKEKLVKEQNFSENQ